MTRLSDAPQMPMAPTAPEGQARPVAVVTNPMAMAQPEQFWEGVVDAKLAAAERRHQREKLELEQKLSGMREPQPEPAADSEAKD